MSESTTKYFQEQVDNFVKQEGYYPEKIIMPESDFKRLNKDRNIECVFTGEEYPVDSSFFKNIKIESDSEIKDWIIIAPEEN